MDRMTSTYDTSEKQLLFGGVDTHKDTHHVAIVDQVGRAVADREFLATTSGYRKIVDFLAVHGLIHSVGVEGTGSYGAELSRVLTRAGVTVLEVARPNRQQRRRLGKSDPIDAQQAALSMLAHSGTATPKSRDGWVESLRILSCECRSAIKARTQTMNQIHSLLVTAEDSVRQDYRRHEGERLIVVLARTRPPAGCSPRDVARQSLKRLALRHQQLTGEIAVIDEKLEQITRSECPRLLAANGVGVVSAAVLLTAVGDNPDRVQTKAQFASLCGVAPIPASSGKRTRYRLSRGGDRQANRALHRIVLLRMRHHEPRTEAYFDRRRSEGLADRDIIRCLKRHVANEIFHTITNSEPYVPTGALLRQQRTALGMHIATLAEQLGVPYQRLRRLEIGQRRDDELVAHARELLARHAEATLQNAA